MDPDDQGGCQDDPQKLVPIEERYAPQGWLERVVKRDPQEGDERQREQPGTPATAALRRIFVHGYVLLVDRAADFARDGELFELHAPDFSAQAQSSSFRPCSATTVSSKSYSACVPDPAARPSYRALGTGYAVASATRSGFRSYDAKSSTFVVPGPWCKVVPKASFNARQGPTLRTVS